MPAPSFTTQDAQNLIQHAQTAPLANLKHAENVSDLLRRFAAWYEQTTRAETTKPPRKARQGSPAVQSEGPAS